MIFLFAHFKSQDFAESQENFVRSHDRETVTFRNSVCEVNILTKYQLLSLYSYQGVWRSALATPGHRSCL